MARDNRSGRSGGRGFRGRGTGRSSYGSSRRSTSATAASTTTTAQSKKDEDGLMQFYMNKPDQANDFVEAKKALVECSSRAVKDGGRMMKAIRDEVDWSEVEPTWDANQDGAWDRNSYKAYQHQQKRKQWTLNSTECDTNKVQTSGIIMKKCSEPLKQKLQAHAQCGQFDMNPILLLKTTRHITQDSDDETHHTKTVLATLRRVVVTQQHEGESLAAFVQRFKNNKEMFETKFGGQINMTACAREDPQYIKGDAATKAALEREAHDGLMGSISLQGSANASQKAEELVRKFNNQYNAGTNNYPTSIDDAHHKIHHHRLEGAPREKKKKPQEPDPSKVSGVVFTIAELGKLVAGTDGKVYPNIKCHKCNCKGHCKPKCPKQDVPSVVGGTNANAGGGAGTGGSSDGRDQNNNNQGNEAARTNSGDTVSTVTQTQGGTQANIGAQFMVANHIRGFSCCMVIAQQIASTNATLKEKMRTWILLDNQSTDHMFCNIALVHDVRAGEIALDLISNGGVLSTTQTAQFGTFKERVWFNQQGVTNILSMSRVKKLGYNASYDEDNDEFIVRSAKGTIEFPCTQEGLHACQVPFDNPQGTTLAGVHKDRKAILQTVEENKSKFSKRQVQRAETARRLCETVGFGSLRDCQSVVQMNGIKNNPVVLDDIKIMKEMYGDHNVFSLKGKATRTKPKVVRKDYIDVPSELKYKCQDVELCADIVFIQGLPFLVTISKHIHLITVDALANRKKKTIAAAFDSAFRIYNDAGFRITHSHCDMEFKCLEDEMMDDDNSITMCYVARKQHVPEVERCIRTIKERVRALWHSLPYKTMPTVMIQYLVCRQVKWLNTFPPKGGISAYHSPRTIMGASPIDCDTHCVFSFGSYVQATSIQEPSNAMDERTKDGIYLDAIDGPQGGHKVLNLVTGKVITSYEPCEIPITPIVQGRVEELGRKDGTSPVLTFNDPLVTDSSDDDFPSIAGVDDNEDDERTAVTEDETTVGDHDDDEHFHLVNEEIEEIDVIDLTEDDEEEVCHNTKAQLNGSSPSSAAPSAPHSTPQEQVIKQEQHDETVDTLMAASEAKMAGIDQALQEFEDLDQQAKRSRKPPEILDPSGGIGSFNKTQSYVNNNANVKTFTKRDAKLAARQIVRKEIPQTSKKKKDAMCHLSTQGMKPDMEYDQQEAIIMATIMIDMVQTYSLKAGMNKWGDKGKQAASAEMKQLHERQCFRPIDVTKLSREEKSKALESLIFLTEKRDGRIKGRACANGSEQRQWMSKDESASPTVSLPSVLITSTIDAHEGREVAIIDIPNAFVQTENVGEAVYMKLRGEMALMLVELCPEMHEDYLVYENDKPALYVRVMKALYGMMQSSLLFYKKFVSDLEKEGFKLNPHDPCVANEMVNGEQLTLTWHVDDVKASHEEKKVIDEFVEWIGTKYEDVTPVKPSRGKVHDYLAMILDCTTPGVVKMDMTRCVASVLEDFKCKHELKAMKTPASPAADHLFKVRDEAIKLDDDKKEEFHTTVAKALFVCKRSRDDLHLTVTFLCTRVKNPDEDDWNELLRMMKYLESTPQRVKTLEMDNLGIVRWWADASFAAHQDMKSHTGGMMTMGKGAVQTVSQKQKLNSESSTEAELIAADDVVSHLMWTKHFLEAQGYAAKQTILHQDNTSAILLEKNGKESSGKRTRHINIRYFCVKDRADNGDLQVECCPTDDMLGDYMTKPTQGKKFRRFRRIILNEKHE